MNANSTHNLILTSLSVHITQDRVYNYNEIFKIFAAVMKDFFYDFQVVHTWHVVISILTPGQEEKE